MTKEQAHENITKLAQSGLISRAEATSYRARIEEIDESDREDEQKAALIAIWGQCH
jgi:hypothetical protein